MTVLLVVLGLALAAGSAAAPPTRDYVVVLKDGTDSAAVATKHRSKYGASVSHVYKNALKGYAASLPASQVAKVAADPDVLFLSEDRQLAAAAPGGFPPPPDPQPAQVASQAVTRIDGPLSSTASGDGAGSVPINVAVLDTGIDLDHLDLNVVGGRNCSPGSGFDDPNGHGTGVAGFIGARDNAIGRVGIAPGARLWSVRVLNKQGHGASSKVICGIDWVTSTRTDADPANDIAVANMSLGGNGSDDGSCGRAKHDPLHLAICRSVTAGVVYVVAAGNDGADIRDGIPAAYDEVLTVTAIRDSDGLPGSLETDLSTSCLPQDNPHDADDSAAYFSNFATLAADQSHTVAAPGVCVGSTYPNDNYAVDVGTSFAAPLGAGTVALCIASGPCAGLTPAQIVAKIVTDAATYNQTHFAYGFQGDPLRPVPGKHYGNLIRAALY